MFSFVRSFLANWLRCETKLNGQPLRKDSSVIVISLQGLTFVLDKNLVVFFVTNILATINFPSRNHIKFQHVIRYGTKYKSVLIFVFSK